MLFDTVDVAGIAVILYCLGNRGKRAGLVLMRRFCQQLFYHRCWFHRHSRVDCIYSYVILNFLPPIFLVHIKPKYTHDWSRRSLCVYIYIHAHTHIHGSPQSTLCVRPTAFTSCKFILASVAFLSLTSQRLFCSQSLLQAREESYSLFRPTYIFVLVLCSCPSEHSEGAVGFRVSNLIKSCSYRGRA